MPNVRVLGMILFIFMPALLNARSAVKGLQELEQRLEILEEKLERDAVHRSTCSPTCKCPSPCRCNPCHCGPHAPAS